MLDKDLSLQYKEFKPFMVGIENTAQFIGAGAESRVFKLQLPFGAYAVKIAKENVENGRGKIMDRNLVTKNKISSGLKGIGIDGLEQFVTGSIEDYTTIYQLAEGTQLNRTKESVIELITYEQKEKLNRTILEATEAGLAFDGANPSGANAFYSPEKGFTLIDYREAYRPLTYRQNWAAALRSLGPVALQAFAN